MCYFGSDRVGTLKKWMSVGDLGIYNIIPVVGLICNVEVCERFHQKLEQLTVYQLSFMAESC